MRQSLQPLIAGSIAGGAADCITHPVSTIKARLQVQGSGSGKHCTRTYRSMTHALSSILRAEGWQALYRGLGAVLLGAAPAQGLYFLGYESAKRQFGGGGFAPGVCAQLCGSLCWVPMDVVKERLQVQGQLRHVSILHRGSMDAFMSIFRSEGILGLYKAYPLHQATWAPFNGIYFMCYERLKSGCRECGYVDAEGQPTAFALLACASTSGVLAGAVTNPLDVLKTRMQVSKANPDMFPFDNGWQAARHLLHHEGVSALLDGLLARVLTLSMRLTICMALYEHVARTLGAGHAP